MKDNNYRPPIFIVGAPRSGTTLLAAMLAAHSQLSCGPETRFFRFLAKTDLKWLYDSWPENAVDFLFSIKLMDPVPEHYGLTREQIHSYLVKRAPSVPAMLSSLTEPFMWRENKCRWVEKSPENLMHVDDIRHYFPHSLIVRIVRDPRDSALSMVKWANGPHDFLNALLFWREYDDRSAAFFNRDERSLTILYEDLVKNPDVELRNICAFIGEEYQAKMLDTSSSASSVVTRKETWKQLAAKPPDQTRIGVWKRELSKEQNRVAEAMIGDRLITYGYERAEVYQCAAAVYPSLDLFLEYRQTLDSFAGDGIRFWQIANNDNGQMMIFIGDPDHDKWLSNRKPERWWDTLRIVAWTLKRKLSNQHIYWVSSQKDDSNLGYCGLFLSFVLRHAGERRFEP